MKFLILLPFISIGILIKIIFNKKNVERTIFNNIKEMNKNSKINFIESKKYSFNKIDMINQTLLATIVAVFVGIKMIGILDAICYQIIAYIFSAFLLFYINLSKLHYKIIEELYKIEF